MNEDEYREDDYSELTLLYVMEYGPRDYLQLDWQCSGCGADNSCSVSASSLGQSLEAAYEEQMKRPGFLGHCVACHSETPLSTDASKCGSYDAKNKEKRDE